MKFGTFLRSAFASADQVEAAQEREVQKEQAGVSPISEATNRSHGSYGGIVRSLVLRPQSGTQTLEVELYDGSGALDLVWLGRRKIAGIEPGSRMRVTGLVTIQNGRPVMFNPRYELNAKTGESK
ncbi:OB-fold nucleic acid binding domain-containing protein [Jonesiaceae bacterium BS-20]|uniref:OB-fold nucleic acid binding domain-containing protein n=1 Tax=Jonesiaceae bacterium BS-20 TaxID=3120821 RepID=A0AAU7E160_9MICO